MSSELKLDLWSQVHNVLRERVGDSKYERWLASLSPLSWEDGVVRLGVANRFVYEWIESRYLADVRAVVAELIDPQLRVELSIDPELFRRHRQGQEEIRRDARQQIANWSAPSAVGVPPSRPTAPGGPAGGAVEENPSARAREPGSPARRATVPPPRAGASRAVGREESGDLGRPKLADFVECDGNRLALHVVRRLVDSIDAPYCPVLIHGAGGVGKTHLARGLADAIEDVAPHLRVRATSGERWSQHYVASAQDNSLERFRERYRTLDVLVIDNLQELAHRERTQLELVRTLDVLRDAGARVLLTANASPRRLEALCPALLDRLLGGLVLRMDRADASSRLAILEQHARRLPSAIRPEVLRFLVDSIPGSLHELVGALLHVDVRARVKRRALRIEEVRPVVAEIRTARRRRVSVDDVLEAAAEHFGVSLDDLRGSGKGRAISLARQAAIHVARRVSEISHGELGRRLGGRHRSTIRAAEARASGRLAEDGQASSESLRAFLARFELGADS